MKDSETLDNDARHEQVARKGHACSEPTLKAPRAAQEDEDKGKSKDEDVDEEPDDSAGATISYEALLNDGLNHDWLRPESSCNSSPAAPSAPTKVTYSCQRQKCSHEFSTLEELRDHEELHRTRRCPVCNHWFARYWNLQQHMDGRVCGSTNCPHCGLFITTPSELLDHRRFCRGNRP